MMQLTCPRCSERFDLQSAVEDDSGRAMMALVMRRPAIVRELIGYMGLFRPRTQALRWSRALALATDIEGLIADHGEAVVGHALREVIEAMRPRLSAPGWRPLGSHNYLRRVLESVASRGAETALAAPVIADQSGFKPTSKTARAMMALREPDNG